jgi:hypothetical protein
MRRSSSRVGVGETHTFGGETADVRRRNLRVRVVGEQIPVAHVIHEDDDDVRGAGGQGRAGRGCHQEREHQVAESRHQGSDHTRD